MRVSIHQQLPDGSIVHIQSEPFSGKGKMHFFKLERTEKTTGNKKISNFMLDSEEHVKQMLCCIYGYDHDYVDDALYNVYLLNRVQEILK